jgi:hypothetical protein
LACVKSVCIITPSSSSSSSSRRVQTQQKFLRPIHESSKLILSNLAKYGSYFQTRPADCDCAEVRILFTSTSFIAVRRRNQTLCFLNKKKGHNLRKEFLISRQQKHFISAQVRKLIFSEFRLSKSAGFR